MTYLPRVIDSELRLRLGAAGAVLIEGPKACGKTASAREVAASEVLLDIDANARAAIEVAPEIVLAGETPRLIDEWQLEPAIWNHVRRAVDERRAPGQFILTGSLVPVDDMVRHTGAGRISRLRMRPMALVETGHSNGTVSLAALLRSEFETTPDPGLTIPEIAERVAVGGWPQLQTLAVPQAIQSMRDYLDETCRVDITRVDGVRRDPARIRRLASSLARNVATMATSTSLAADTGGDEGPIGADTVREYLAALDRLMVVEDQPAWAPHLRSRSILRSSPKRHFVDPALAVAALRATPDRLLREIRWLGQLFESLVVRDLRIAAQANDAVVHHYRDNLGLEIDAVVASAGGPWAAFEIKLGHAAVDDAASQLRSFAERVDTSICGEPAMLGVIVGSGYGYRRPDGVAVIPIGSLGP
ncbi:MAG: DUF4143 domain-containing protein [Gemmatimonadales bacterium]|nr:DUF4143 domain-containing protein [Gemmatimonadales bacterium]MDZ4389987.1 DUF4143 domain-containing protein [Gemmatimonadales bacterium]